MQSGRLYLVNIVIRCLPPTRMWGLKRAALRWAGARVGLGARLVSSTRIYMTGSLSIGENTFIGHEVLIVGGNADIKIGSHVDIAPRVSLISGTHAISTVGPRAAGLGISLPITVCDGAWIGAGATILGGVEIGRGSIVAAGALVHRNVPAQCLVAGVPAKLVKQLINESVGDEVA